MSKDWTGDYFRGMALAAWRTRTPPQVTARDADCVEQALALADGARVLDAPCGDGRLALELARRGHRVTGVDQDAGQLRAAATAAREAGVDAAWLEADMRDLAPALGDGVGRFDGVCCFGNSFGYFGAADTAAFLAGLGAALRPGGRLLVDTDVAAESLLPNLTDRVWESAGEITVLAEYWYDPVQGRLDSRHTFFRETPEGISREEKDATHWVFSIAEIGRMLRAAGLTVRSLHGDTDLTPYAPGDPRLLLVAEK